ncbi:MAG: shikimate dehydrogenase [Clostridiales bacterium]|nr:shikimate dehydrogenase [Clostridiales bacterium]
MKDFVTYGLIGDPVRHSFSPTVFNTFFEYYGENAAFITILIRKGEIPKLFDEYVDTLALGGFTCTMPQKEDIIPFLDELSDAARECQSVNVVSLRDGKRFGHTTDGLGNLRSFEATGRKAKDQKVVIYGVGGACKSIAQAYRAAGADVTILSRNPEKAEAVAKSLGGMKGGDSSKLKSYLPECTLYINGSPLGMKGSPDFEDFSFLDLLPKNASVYDCVYNPRETSLIKEARLRGLHTVDGLMMLLAQMGVLFETLTGITPDEKITEVALKKVSDILAGK